MPDSRCAGARTPCLRLVRVGVDPRVPEPPLPPAGSPALARLPVLGLPDPGALDRAFPPRPQRLHPAVVRALGRGQVQVPAGIRAQPHPVPHARLLKGVPVRQVPGQPVDVPDDHHVNLAGLDRRDQLGEPVPGDFLEPGVPVILEGGHDGPAAPGRARWAARRAQASETGASDGAWLEGDAAAAIACDAAMAPVVTGDVDIDALEDLVRLCVELDARRRDGTRDAAWAAIEQQVIGKAVDLLSGPGGLASFLRRRQLGVRLGGPSLPLDIGYSESIPAGIRNAVLLRDRHCQWAGGCTQPAGACQVHHTTHKADGGKTSVKDCVLLCPFHHQVVIHRWGWTLVVNPDGTTSAWNKNKTKTKVLHSHGPPARAG